MPRIFRRCWRQVIVGTALALVVGCSSAVGGGGGGAPYPNYIEDYASFLGPCVRSLEATYGPAPSGPRRAQYVTICDTEFFAARPGLREWLNGEP